MKHPAMLKRTASIDYMKRFMSSLDANQSKLREIQSVYDNLALLGQLLCAGTDITGMRRDYSVLADELINQLACELSKKAVSSLASSSKVAIDMLVRNLYERTADIGFLATDSEIRQFAETHATSPVEKRISDRIKLQCRFNEYAQKYSVYHNIILLSPSGSVLAQLDDISGVTSSKDVLIGESLTTEAHYVETFRQTDLLPNIKNPLIYSYRVMSEDGSTPVGVLCLCFRFEDECERIFRNLVKKDDWTVVTILNEQGRIIASSNVYEFPEGAQLEMVQDQDSKIVRFAGREYLATTSHSEGYQGYQGPGWVGHALSPLNHAFEMAEAHELDHVSDELLSGVLQTATLFSEALRSIPERATSIQNELNRAVWNGNIWLNREHAAINTTFAKVLLWEIGSTGIKTRDVFSESAQDLYETVISSVLFSCGNQAALAIDIMDRNLYERANDCRWWALTASFKDGLRSDQQNGFESRQKMTQTLREINGLYTVYSNILLFNAYGRVVAVSNPAYSDLIGQNLAADWVRPCLGLQNTQRYKVSEFVPTNLYGNKPTYIYAASISDEVSQEPLGGIALVFDAGPQFKSMLYETLPRDEVGHPVQGALAVFADKAGRVIASSDERQIAVGVEIVIPKRFLEVAKGETMTDIIVWENRYYAIGSCKSSGYREFKSEIDDYQNEVFALVLTPLSAGVSQKAASFASPGRSTQVYSKRQTTAIDGVELATFTIGEGWYGIPSHYVVEAFEAKSITAVPGMPSWVRGCIMHNDQTVAIVDLRGFLTGETPKMKGQLVVMVQVPGQRKSYGVLVDELGEIPTIASTRIDSALGVLTSNSMTDALVRPVDPQDDRILIILSVERMIEKLSSGMGEPAEPELLTLMPSQFQNRQFPIEVESRLRRAA